LAAEDGAEVGGNAEAEVVGSTSPLAVRVGHRAPQFVSNRVTQGEDPWISISENSNLE